MPACVLPPAGVGGDEPEGSTTSPGEGDGETEGTDDGEATTDAEPPAAVDEFPEEIAVNWYGMFPRDLDVMPNGDGIALLSTLDTSSISRFDASGAHWTRAFPWGIPLELDASPDGAIAVGGVDGFWPDEGPPPIPTLWILDGEGELVSQVPMEQPRGEVTAIEYGPEALWSATRGLEGSYPPGTGMLRRHAMDGTVELEVFFEGPIHDLAVRPDGQVYVLAESHPDEFQIELTLVDSDGELLWTSPVDFDPAYNHTNLFVDDDQSVIAVSAGFGELRVTSMEPDGAESSAFIDPQVDWRASVDIRSGSLLHAHGGIGSELVVSGRQRDGATLWEVPRVLEDAVEVETKGVVVSGDMAIVVLDVIAPEGGTSRGLARYIPLP
ncbi:MAG: hypothetical protein AAF799_00880 [Myxococcota bacterium]